MILYQQYLMSMMRGRSKRRLRGGSAAIEFALVAPLFVLMLMGMVVYGGWFWLAQSVQTLATESARAAVAGLDSTERNALARAFITAEATRSAGLAADHLSVAVESDASAIRVRLTFDARDHWAMMLSGLVPSPPAMIQRTAVVRIGGY